MSFSEIERVAAIVAATPITSPEERRQAAKPARVDMSRTTKAKAITLSRRAARAHKSALLFCIRAFD